MSADPVASLNSAISSLEEARRRAIDSLAAATAVVEKAASSKSAAAARDAKAAARQVAAAADRLGTMQFQGEYRGTNASFLPAGDRKLLAGMAVGTAALLAGWLFMIATIASARLESGEALRLGGIWTLVALVGGFLVAGVLLAYGFKSVHVSVRSVDGETAEMEQSAEIHARKQLERQLTQATRDLDRTSKRAEKSEAEVRAARVEVKEAEVRAREAIAARDGAVGASGSTPNGAVAASTAKKVVPAAD